jgi:ribosomal protein S18 acetylase RimI-like enzyme
MGAETRAWRARIPRVMRTHLATLEDVEEVADLLGAQLEEHSIVLDASSLRSAIRGIVEQPSRGAILVGRDPRPIGVACLSFVWTLEHGGQSAWLDELYVVPAMRSRGIGTQLLREAMAHAARVGCHAIDLEVDQDHARAQRLYEREGFQPHRRARWVRKL